MDTWKTKFDQELGMALAARERKNEGQARVCARRAAGVVVREYFLRRGVNMHNPSAYDLLNQLLQIGELPIAAREAAGYLVLRVTEEFRLPVDVDLVAQARRLADALLED